MGFFQKIEDAWILTKEKGLIKCQISLWEEDYRIALLLEDKVRQQEAQEQIEEHKEKLKSIQQARKRVLSSF